jgi:hypothetical protein
MTLIGIISVDSNLPKFGIVDNNRKKKTISGLQNDRL